MRSLVAIVALGLIGCGTLKESDRELNYQNKRAGELIENSAESDEIKQAGRDIKDNSTQLENVIGTPENPQPYSPQISAAIRDRSKVEHEKKWYDFILPVLAGIIGGGGLLKIAGRFAPKLLGGPAGVALSAVIEGVENVRVKAEEAEDKKISAENILEELAKVQDNAGVRELIRTWRAKLNL